MTSREERQRICKREFESAAMWVAVGDGTAGDDAGGCQRKSIRELGIAGLSYF
jgi:hypothetical protein